MGGLRITLSLSPESHGKAMTFPTEVVASAVMAIIGGGLSVGAWALRLDGRVRSHEQADNLIHAHMNEKLDDLKQDMKDVKEHLGVKTRATLP